MPDLLTIQLTYWAVMMAVFLGSFLLRRLTAVSALQRHGGAGPLTGAFTVRVYAEMRRYRELCEQRGQSLRWWRLWWGLHVTLWIMMAGWFALIALAR